MPDTRAMLYRIHGQVDYSLNKKPKTTYITEIFDNQKKHKRPGPNEYKTESALDFV